MTDNRDTAVVTGAGSGIGAAVTHRLARAGYATALCGRRGWRLEATAAKLPEAATTTHPGDLEDPEQVETIAAAIVREHGTVSAIVHCAGGLGIEGAGLAGYRDSMLASFASNVITTALLTRALLPSVADQRGRIVAMSSIAAFRGGGLDYAAAKSALHGWAFTLADQVGLRGITVNVVAPGFIDDTELFGDAMTPARHERLVSETLVGRPGRPRDVASLVEYLVSPDSGHLTAQVLQINGGALAR